MRLAIFGGTFDPIHQAHLAVAREAVARCKLDRVLFVPAAGPPHKAGVTHAGYEDRIRMAEAACEGEPRFQVSRLEEGTVRSFSIDTIEAVRAQLAPDDELFFILGADAFAEIRTWHRWPDVIRAVRFIVVSRPGHVYEVPQGASVEPLNNVSLSISSSEIRRSLAAGQTPAEVPARVMAYIQTHHLYRCSET